MTSVLLLLAACDYGFTLPSGDAIPESISPGDVLPIRKRRTLLPGSVTGPPPPDAGITSDQCDKITDGGGLQDDCVTGTLQCDSVTIGHTRGGVEKFGTKFYERAFCTPATTNHNSGDERVYILDMPENTRALVHLDSPCANLDIAAVKYTSDYCPSESSNISQCEMYPKPTGRRETVDLWNQNAAKWYIVVEGQDDEEGAFALTVQCEHINW